MLVNHEQFKGGDSTKHRQKHLVHWVGLLARERNAFLLEHDGDALAGQLLYQGQQVISVTGKVTDFVHNYRVALAYMSKHGFELWAVGVRAAALVGKGRIERHAVQVARCVLAYAANPDVRYCLACRHVVLLVDVRMKYLELLRKVSSMCRCILVGRTLPGRETGTLMCMECIPC
jgi:hypothetical protein